MRHGQHAPFLEYMMVTVAVPVLNFCGTIYTTMSLKKKLFHGTLSKLLRLALLKQRLAFWKFANQKTKTLVK